MNGWLARHRIRRDGGSSISLQFENTLLSNPDKPGASVFASCLAFFPAFFVKTPRAIAAYSCARQPPIPTSTCTPQYFVKPLVILLHVLPTRTSVVTKAFLKPVILGAVSRKQRPVMSKKIIRMVAVAALTAAASLSAMAGDMNNMLGGALGGVAGAALGGAMGGSTGAVIGGAVGGGAGGAVTSNRRERTGAIIGGALGGGAGTAAGNAMGGRTGGLVGAAVGGGAGSALGGNVSRSNSYADDYSRGYRSGKRHHKHRHYD
jgi:hypothetical protein